MDEGKKVTQDENRKIYELCIQKAREVFRDLDHVIAIENLPIGVALCEIILDEDGKPYDYRYLYVNPAFEKLTGLKRENIMGRTVLELFPDIEKIWIDTYGKVALTGKYVQFEQYTVILAKMVDRLYPPLLPLTYFLSIFLCY